MQHVWTIANQLQCVQERALPRKAEATASVQGVMVETWKFEDYVYVLRVLMFRNAKRTVVSVVNHDHASEFPKSSATSPPSRDFWAWVQESTLDRKWDSICLVEVESVLFLSSVFFSWKRNATSVCVQLFGRSESTAKTVAAIFKSFLAG